MKECKYCKDFNEESEEIRIEQIQVSTLGYYNYDCPIKYCPSCGKVLDRYSGL